MDEDSCHLARGQGLKSDAGALLPLLVLGLGSQLGLGFADCVQLGMLPLSWLAGLVSSNLALDGHFLLPLLLLAEEEQPASSGTGSYHERAATSSPFSSHPWGA